MHMHMHIPLRVIEIQELQMESIRCRNMCIVDINTAELTGLGTGEKIIQIAGISSKENPKDGVRVRLLILNTFHKATDLQIQDKTQSLA